MRWARGKKRHLSIYLYKKKPLKFILFFKLTTLIIDLTNYTDKWLFLCKFRDFKTCLIISAIELHSLQDQSIMLITFVDFLEKILFNFQLDIGNLQIISNMSNEFVALNSFVSWASNFLNKMIKIHTNASRNDG